jgi:hypothetical protein
MGAPTYGRIAILQPYAQESSHEEVVNGVAEEAHGARPRQERQGSAGKGEPSHQPCEGEDVD